MQRRNEEPQSVCAGSLPVNVHVPALRVLAEAQHLMQFSEGWSRRRTQLGRPADRKPSNQLLRSTGMLGMREETTFLIWQGVLHVRASPY